MPWVERHYYVYILASQRNGTLYIGFTNNLIRRIQEHREKEIQGFTRQYGVDKLVYYECYGRIPPALYREKQLKHWNRAWKMKLIEGENPQWKDLFDELIN